MASRKPVLPPEQDPTESLTAAVSNPVGAVVRAVQRGLHAMRGGLVLFYNSNNLTFASSIAFYTLLSVFPFLLLVLSAIGRLAAADGSVGPNLANLVARAVPSRFDFLIRQLELLAGAPIELSVLGTVLLVLGSIGVFGAITAAVNHAWGVDEDYSFWKQQLVAFVMMLAAGALAVAALLLISAVQVVEARWFAGVLADHPGLGQLSSAFYRNVPTAMFIVVVGLIYYFIPNAQMRLRDVWFGAVLAGVLWRGAFSLFAWYVRDLSRFTVHGSVAAVVMFLLWVYLSAIILLYGVEVTVAWTRSRRPAE